MLQVIDQSEMFSVAESRAPLLSERKWLLFLNLTQSLVHALTNKLSSFTGSWFLAAVHAVEK